MRFAPLRLAQRICASCAPSISSWSFRHLSAISGRQYGQISRSVRHASARLTSPAISWRGALRSAPHRGALYRGAATSGCPVRAIFVWSACRSIGWSSSVLCRSPVLWCLLPSGYRRAHPIVTFDKRLFVFTRSQILHRDSSEFSRGFVCCIC